MFGNLFENLLVVGILLALFILAYCKWTGKTLTDVYREVRDMLVAEATE